MTYDNIKSHKKPGFDTLFKRYIFRKTTGGGSNFYYSEKIKLLLHTGMEVMVLVSEHEREWNGYFCHSGHKNLPKDHYFQFNESAR